MADHQAKAALFDALAEAAKAMSSGRRAELIDVLAQGERSVEELAEEIDQTVANTSQHLQRLLRSGLVKSRRDGLRIHYSLSSPVVFALWRTMREAASSHVQQLDELARAYLGDRGELGTINRDELRGFARATWLCSTYARGGVRGGPHPGSAVHTVLRPEVQVEGDPQGD